MNFLGHCLFSENTPDAYSGSLWPDFARRPESPDCSDSFYRHFDRHQWIDKTTDTSDILEPLRVSLRPLFRKTTPVIVDMILDHHIALHWKQYHSTPLGSFAEEVYDKLLAFNDIEQPKRLQQTLYWMQKHNWFVAYQQPDGIKRALNGMSGRIRFNNPIIEYSDHAIKETHTFEATLFDFVQHLSTELSHNP